MSQNIMDRLASGLFGGLLGPNSDALSPEAQQAANSQGLLSMAGGMLTASQNPFATFGGSVGQGLLAGQQGFRNALDTATAAKLRGARSKHFDAQGTSLLRKTQAELERERRWQELLNPSVQTFGAQRPPTPKGVPIDSDQQPSMTQGLAPQNAAAPTQARFNDPLWLVSTGQRAMANGFIDRGKKMIEAGVNLRPEMTTLMRNAEAAGFKPGTPEYQEFIRAQLAKPGQTINVNTANNAFEQEFGKQNAKQFFEQRDAAQQAADSLVNNAQARNLLDSGVITGFGANIKVGFGKALQEAGIHMADDPIANTEAFIASRAKETGRLIQLFGAGTGLSDADREFANKAAGGDITMSEQSIRKILELNEKAARHVIDRYNNEAQAINSRLSPYPLTVSVPESSQSEPQSPSSTGGVKFLGFE